ncbi:Uncharacterised protein [Segatella copri]|nr:Uncharacterised protein [Segatella copri]
MLVHSPGFRFSSKLWSLAPVLRKEIIAMMITTAMTTKANPMKKSVIVLLKIYCKPIASLKVLVFFSVLFLAILYIFE